MEKYDLGKLLNTANSNVKTKVCVMFQISHVIDAFVGEDSGLSAEHNRMPNFIHN